MRQIDQNCGTKFPGKTAEAVVQQFQRSRCKCMKFQGTFSSIKKKNPTGCPTDDDINRASLAVYNNEATVLQISSFLQDKTVYCGPQSVFMEALQYLRATHTWSMIKVSQNANRQNVEMPTEEIVQVNEDCSCTDDHVFSTPILQKNKDIITLQNVSKEKAHPSIQKGALEISRQLNALKNGVEATKKVAEAANEKCKIFQKMLDLDRLRSMIDLFPTPEMDEKIKSIFLKQTQLKALEILDKQHSTSSELKVL